MNKTAKPARDAFTFSLGGLTTISSFVPMHVVASDRINKAIGKRLANRAHQHNQGCDQDGTARHGLYQDGHQGGRSWAA